MYRKGEELEKCVIEISQLLDCLEDEKKKCSEAHARLQEVAEPSPILKKPQGVGSLKDEIQRLERGLVREREVNEFLKRSSSKSQLYENEYEYKPHYRGDFDALNAELQALETKHSILLAKLAALKQAKQLEDAEDTNRANPQPHSPGKSTQLTPQEQTERKSMQASIERNSVLKRDIEEKKKLLVKYNKELTSLNEKRGILENKNTMLHKNARKAQDEMHRLDALLEENVRLSNELKTVHAALNIPFSLDDDVLHARAVNDIKKSLLKLQGFVR